MRLLRWHTWHVSIRVEISRIVQHIISPPVKRRTARHCFKFFMSQVGLSLGLALVLALALALVLVLVLVPVLAGREAPMDDWMLAKVLALVEALGGLMEDLAVL